MAMVTETRDLKDFDEVALQGRGDIVLEQGEVESVVIEADEEVMPHIKAEVVGGRLVLGLEHWWDHLLRPVAPLHFRVTVVTVKRVSISGSGLVRAETLRTEDLQLDISGSGEMQLAQLTARAVSMGVSGAGKMTVSGEAERVDLRISGSGNLQAGNLAAQAVKIHISGSGRVAVNAAQTLDVQISGSGSVTYAGQPQVSQRVSGAGSIQQVTAAAAAAGMNMETGEGNAGRGARGARRPRPPVPPERPMPSSPPPDASSAEQMAILKMVEEGRITPEEADTLLKALGAQQ